VVDADDLRFVHLATAQGLSQTRAQQIIQDDDGFIWFGTQYGLNRYDGYKFKAFTHDPRVASSLGGDYIFSLFKDHSGCLWVGTDQTLDRFDPKTESFVHYSLRVPDLDVSDIIAFHINEDSDGQIWLATGSGLFRLNPRSGKMTLFQHDPTDPLSLSDNSVSSTLEDRSGRFWVANRTGVDEFDWHTGKVSVHIPIRAPAREFLLYEDRNGLLWLAYASRGGAGLSTYDPKSNILNDYAFATEDGVGATFTGIYAVTEDQEGTLWFGTGGMGVLKLDRARQRFVRYRHNPEDPDSIAEDHVTTLVKDTEGNLWVGLNSREPNVFSPRPPLFRHVMHHFDSRSGGEALINSIFQDSHGGLWIGVTGGLTRLDPQGGTTAFYRTDEHGGSAGVVAIVEDSTGDLWLGTVGQGLKRLNPRTGKMKTYRHDPSNLKSLSDDVVQGLRVDGPRKLWVATWDGLDLFDTATESFTVYKRDANRRTERYDKIAADGQGRLWIVSDFGVTRFDPRDSKFTLFQHADRPGAISSNDVQFVLIDSDGRPWIATQRGLNGFNADSSFTTYYEPDGLGGNAVSCILEDEAGSLWLSTNRGISRFERKTQKFTNYSSADGLGDLTGWNACFRSSDGEMFFGGFSGLVSFYPDKVVDAPSHAPIRFAELKVGGQTARIGAAGPLRNSIVHTDELTLADEQRNFSLEFASLNFLNAEFTRYRYKMEGLDRQWNEVASDQRIVSYTSLPPGSYNLRVQAAVSRGPWAEPGTMLRIHILPPWWKSWWLTTTLAAFMVLLAWAAYRYRVRRIAQQFDIRLEERVNERTRIARELHDSLLQGFQGLMFRLQAVRDLLPDRPGEAVEELEGALDRADKAIVEGREAVSDLRAAAVIESDLEQLLTGLGDELEPAKGEALPSYRVLVEGKPRRLAPLVRDEVYRIAREAFRNAVQHARAGHIEAELDFGQATFCLRVRDDGVGVDRDALASRSRGGHWGVQGMRERAATLGGNLELWSEHGVGTEVELTIPANKAYARGSFRAQKPPR
jgi:ligand-binding sensor domain-containing protein/signal transduction histidine kinase